jgi:threonylcarbamoyladenosine tRNA methylthiotransferase MtaB
MVSGQPQAGDAAPRGSRPIRTAAIINLGCKVNQAEMESAARHLRERGVGLVSANGGVSANGRASGNGGASGAARADLVVVNTCTVTAEADAKSRHAVRRARRANPGAEIVVTGCSVQVGREAFAEADPAARLVDNGHKDGLLAELEALVGDDGAAAGGLGAARFGGALPTLSGVEIDGIDDGRAAVERTRAFIKVQDGCSFFCTYCIIPAARGAERSLSPATVLADVRRALRAGHREIVLTGINIGTYDGGWSERGFRGSHVRSALTLAGLVQRILDETDIERIRISSIEPQHVDDELLRAWTDGAPRTLPHIHLPLQSGDDGVLRRMGRRYLSGNYARTVDRVRAAIPAVAVHGDVIVGFPTEDDAAWRRSLDFIRSVDFAGIHVFRYSARPGTAAVRMAGAVAEPTKKARAAELLELAAAARARRAESLVGTVAEVLFESRLADGRWVGHAADYVTVATGEPAMAPGDGSLANGIGRVAVDGVDPGAGDRAVGRILSVTPPLAGASSFPVSPTGVADGR